MTPGFDPIFVIGSAAGLLGFVLGGLAQAFHESGDENSAAGLGCLSLLLLIVSLVSLYSIVFNIASGGAS